MKKALSISFLVLLTFSIFGQSQKNDKNFEKGLKAFESSKYKEAI